MHTVGRYSKLPAHAFVLTPHSMGKAHSNAQSVLEMILKQMLDRNPQNKELLKLLRETINAF